jgi:glycine/serine hydroxymethyltransferase
MTTRGFGPAEMSEVAAIIVETLNCEQTEEGLDRLLARGRALTAAFPLYRTLGA